MKNDVQSLAVFGGEPNFSKKLPVGQLNFPSWEKFECAFQDIFKRRYYTNHGPLGQRLEERLAEQLGVKHVVCTANATISLMIAAKALNLKGKVIVPAFTFAATVQALSWCGLEPVFCDVDYESQMINADQVENLISDDVCAILGVHLWGNACDPETLMALAIKYDIEIFFDAAHAIGCTHSGQAIGKFGALEVFSFHATKVLNAAEGGCISTNDDELAQRLRNIRSSYGAGEYVEVPITCNGRMSEAQAAMALLSLDEFSEACHKNKKRYQQYVSALDEVPGLTFVKPADKEESNFQYVVIVIDKDYFGLTRDQLETLLVAENILCRRYFLPGLHRSAPYCDDFPQYVDALPVTDKLCQSVLQLPSGGLVDIGDIKEVSELIILIHENSDYLKEKFFT